MRNIARRALLQGTLLVLAVALGSRAGAAGLVPVYATYLGGNAADVLQDIAVDPQGNAYIVGNTDSPDFPITRPWGAGPAFLTKLDPRGALVFSTWLWQGDHEPLPNAVVHAVALGPPGSLYVTGSIQPDRQDDRGVYGFIARISTDGSAVHFFKTFWTGSITEGLDLAVDGQGRANVLVSVDFSSVTFVRRYNPDGSEDLAGRSSPELGGLQSIAVAANGDVVVAGRRLYGASNGFVARISGMTSIYEYDLEEGIDDFLPESVAVMPDDGVVVVGEVFASNLPHLFAARLNAAGEVLFRERFGGAGSLAKSVAATPGGDFYVAGWGSLGFPAGEPPCDLGDLDCPNVYVLRFQGGTGEIVSSATLGGSGLDFAISVATGPGGGAYTIGYTDSPDLSTVNAFQPSYSGLADGFVARLSDQRPPDCSGASAGPALLWPPNGKLAPVSIRGVNDPDGDPVTLRVTSIRQDEPLSKKGQPDAAGLGTGAAQVRADRSGGGDGRVYHLAFEAADGRGGSCTGEVTVCVPHDQGLKTCGDGGALYDSTGSQR